MGRQRQRHRGRESGVANRGLDDVHASPVGACLAFVRQPMSVNTADRITQPSEALNGLYDRHLAFDNVVDPATVGPRQRYEALAHSVRDILSQRWVLTEQTYARENPK